MVKAEWFSKEDTCRFIQLFACAIIIINKLAVVGLTFLIIVVILFSQKDKAEALSFYIVKIKSFVDTYAQTMLQVWEHKWKTFKKKKKRKVEEKYRCNIQNYSVMYVFSEEENISMGCQNMDSFNKISISKNSGRSVKGS